MKKRGFGAGKWNGFGGKLEPGESFEEGARRELEEESSLQVHPGPENLKSIGYLSFRMEESRLYMQVHVFETWTFEGTATESEEMRPQWFREDEIPFNKMWPDDQHWFPYLLANKRFIGNFQYEDEDTISDYVVREQ